MSGAGGEVVRQRDDFDAPILVERRVLHLELLCDGTHVVLRLGQRDPGLQARDDAKKAARTHAPVTVGKLGGGQHVQRLPQPREAGRKNADDGVRLSIETDGPAQGIARRAESFHPQPVAQDGHRGSAGAGLLLAERAAEQRLDSEHGQEPVVGRNPLQHDGISRSGDVPHLVEDRAHVAEHLIAGLPIQVVGHGDDILVKAAAVLVFPNHHQAVRLRVVDGPENNGFDQAEDRRAPADAHGQRDNRDGGKHGSSAQHPESVPEVPRQPLPESRRGPVLGLSILDLERQSAPVRQLRRGYPLGLGRFMTGCQSLPIGLFQLRREFLDDFDLPRRFEL